MSPSLLELQGLCVASGRVQCKGRAGAGTPKTCTQSLGYPDAQVPVRTRPVTRACGQTLYYQHDTNVLTAIMGSQGTLEVKPID